jgi:zinc protease
MFLNGDARRCRAVRIAVAVMLAMTAPLAAQSPAKQQPPAAKTDTKAAAELPAAREIIDRYIAAIGGRDAVLSHTSMHVTGTFAVPASGIQGQMEIYSATKPDRALQKVTIPGVGEVTTGYDGEHGWTVNPMTGPMLQQGKELEQARFEADFYGELRDPKKYKSITTLEKTTFEGRPCYKLSLVHLDGTEDFEFYDAETALRAGGVSTRETPMGSVTSTTAEGEYKKFGNVLQATTLALKAMGVEQKITVTTVEYDNVAATVFEPPAAVKALMK